MQLQELVDHDAGILSPALIAGALRTTKAEIADTLGLSRDALSRTTRVRATKTQTRLREMVVIPRRIGRPFHHYAWSRQLLDGGACNPLGIARVLPQDNECPREHGERQNADHHIETLV